VCVRISAFGVCICVKRERESLMGVRKVSNVDIDFQCNN